MILIVGLGNPGEEFKATRHNIGRETALIFHAKYGLKELRFEKNWNLQIAEGKIGKEKIAILIPNTFMNKSGIAVSAAARFYKTKPPNIFVIHDDADIRLGHAKLSFGKKSAGHKGVESLIRALGTKDFWRFRIGVGGKKNIPAEKIILKRFTPEELRTARKMIKLTLKAVETAIQEGSDRAMNEYNQ